LAASRVDIGTRYVTVCVVSLVAGRNGGKRDNDNKCYTMRCMERGFFWGGGGRWGNREQKKKAFSSIFTNDTKSFIHVTRIAAMHIIYMCRLRHINDSVLLSLKMEGISLLFICIVINVYHEGHSESFRFPVRYVLCQTDYFLTKSSFFLNKYLN
jgi:hypothetical protein